HHPEKTQCLRPRCLVRSVSAILKMLVGGSSKVKSASGENRVLIRAPRVFPGHRPVRLRAQAWNEQNRGGRAAPQIHKRAPSKGRLMCSVRPVQKLTGSL